MVTFSAGGPVANGVSPLPYTVTGSPQYVSDHILPNGLSHVLTGTAATLTFPGKLMKHPLSGGSCSVEFILSPPTSYSAQGVVVTIPNILELSFSSYSTDPPLLPAPCYTLSVAGVQFGINFGASSAGADHIVINIDGPDVTLIVNGEESKGEIPEDLAIVNEYVSGLMLSVSTGVKLWGVAVRPSTVMTDYAQEVTDLVRSFPTPAEADAPFRPVTFDFDKENVDYTELVSLDDVRFGGEPLASNFYNGSRKWPESDPTSPPPRVSGEIPITDATGIEYTLSEGNLGAVSILSDLMNPDGQSGTIPVVNTNTFDSKVVPLNRVTNGDPSAVIIDLNPSMLSKVSSSEMVTNLGFLPSVISVPSTSMADRTATLDPTGSGIRGRSGAPLMNGGLWGRAYIEVDPSAASASDYPEAYGSWVSVGDALVNVAKTSGFTVTVSASGVMTATGTSGVYVDGILKSSGSTLSKGWHFIMLVPSVKSNLRIEIGSVPSGNTSGVVKSFTCYYLPAPASYAESLYRMYVDPPKIRPSIPDSFTLSESTTRIYSNDWSDA